MCELIRDWTTDGGHDSPTASKWHHTGYVGSGRLIGGGDIFFPGSYRRLYLSQILAHPTCALVKSL
jgi:hypothetical protein